MLLTLGGAVFNTFGDPIGELDRILVDPDRRLATHIVIKSPRASEEVILPIGLLQGNLGSRLFLLPASDDLENFPRYEEGRAARSPADRVDTAFVRQPPERRADLTAALAVPENAVDLSPDTAVETADGRSLGLTGVLTDDALDRISAIDLCEPDGAPHRVAADAIASFTPDRIGLTLPIERLRGAPGGAARPITDTETTAL